MTAEKQMRVWLIGAAVFIALLFLLRGVLLPFVAGMGVAYLLDPVCDRLERMGLSRTLATVLVMAVSLVVFILFLLLLAPLIVSQFLDFLAQLPKIVDSLRAQVENLMALLRDRLDPETLSQLRESLRGSVSSGVAWMTDLLGGVLSGGVALINLLSLLFITPIVAFYLLRDWDVMVSRIDDYLPRRHRDTIRDLVRQADETLAGFVRGQAAVCFVLGLFYMIGLVVLGLEFGFVVGLLAGLLTFIPYVGSLTGLVLSVGLAIAQFDEPWRIAAVAILFFVGQAVEGNYLTPKLVGERTGLHAVWVIFALLAGGALFGFLGVLLALPVTAVIGVLVRFGLQRYRQSALFGIEDETESKKAEGGM
ncbi:AI-2E family transporter [Limibacillus sp. MBR-115]|uniref:AI-2E family transporter n=1 Tax=Limibacillus sp. MBR-115 TaxID=3156465 RepID=UPI003396A85E